jgi:hypothetical protein
MLFAAVLAAALSGGPSSVVALARCNNYNATHFEDQVRDYEKHPPTSPADRDARFAALEDVVSNANNEAIILQGICSPADFQPIAAQLFAVEAWSLALESDLSRQKDATACPAAETPVARGYVANAWLLLARADLEGTGRYPTVQTVLPKVQSRAAALNLTLPARIDTTNYWMNTVRDAGTEAAKNCPK